MGGWFRRFNLRRVAEIKAFCVVVTENVDRTLLSKSGGGSISERVFAGGALGREERKSRLVPGFLARASRKE